jgi:hypothetical protein
VQGRESEGRRKKERHGGERRQNGPLWMVFREKKAESSLF